MFQAIGRANRTSLRTLAKTFIDMENLPAALLCLHHIFSSQPKLQDLPLSEVQESLSTYLDYIRLLNKFRRDESLAQGSNHQRLFGFQALRGSRYLVPRHTPLHDQLTNLYGSNAKDTDGYECSYEELRQGITQFISRRIQERTEAQNNACRDIHGFSPCLSFLVEKECNPPDEEGPCTFQHIQPEQLTVDWYHARLRLVLLQFQILDSARYGDLDVKKYVLFVHSVRNVYGYSFNVKLLAWDVVLSAPSAFPEAWIARESRHY